MKLIRFGAMDVTKPYKSIMPWILQNHIKFTRFGAMAVTKPYKIIRCGATYATKPYTHLHALGPWMLPTSIQFIRFGAMDATEPCKFMGPCMSPNLINLESHGCHQTV